MRKDSKREHSMRNKKMQSADQEKTPIMGHEEKERENGAMQFRRNEVLVAQESCGEKRNFQEKL
jgi:hypothetical protein